MNKEECKKMIENLPRLIPAKEEYGYGCSMLEFEETIDFFNKLYKQLYEPKPYEFEDLKENMWVYDINLQGFLKVLKKYKFKRLVVQDNYYEWDIKFEKNRFYPLTKAMEVKQ